MTILSLEEKNIFKIYFSLLFSGQVALCASSVEMSGDRRISLE